MNTKTGVLKNGVILGLILLIIGTVVAAETENPHEISSDSAFDQCLDCHQNEPQINLNDNELLTTKNNRLENAAFKQDGVAMCAPCHDPNNGHKVGLNIDFPVPADLPLDANDTMTCLTCHYTHGSLGSDRPQASYSFMDKLTDADRLHKSFLLRRSNIDGELCLICHNVSKGSR